MPDYIDQNGKAIVLGTKLGQSKEGSVYQLSDDPHSVVKIFISQKRCDYAPKLAEMIANPPKDQTRSFNPPHISIAWPERIVYENQQFVGYTMPTIKKAPDIETIYSPVSRSQEFPKFSWYNLHHVALNLICAVNAFHAAGYVIGDLNSRNVKVHENSLVTMVDTDSIQVKTSTGKILRCPVGVPDFTPPELQATKLDQVDRDVYHDAFALSVMIFLLLMEGYHPFTGASVNNAISVPSPAYQYFISKGIFPYNCNSSFTHPKNAPDYAILHPEIRALFDRCFKDASSKNRTNRPLPMEWYKTLKKTEKDLVKCGAGHFYYAIYGECPWCKRQTIMTKIKKSSPQPVKPVVPLQSPIQPVLPLQKPVPPPPSPIRPARKTPLPVQPQPKPPDKFNMKFGIIVGAVILVLTAGLIGISGLFKRNSHPYSYSPITQNSGASDQNNQPATSAENNISAATDFNLECDHAPSLQFSVGDHVLVQTNTSLRGHSNPDLSSTDVIVRYQYGNPLVIVDGPVCVRADDTTSYWFWQVQDDSGVISWLAEGEQDHYYLSAR